MQPILRLLKFKNKWSYNLFSNIVMNKSKKFNLKVDSLFVAIISKYINSHFIMLICAILVLLVSIIWISIKELRVLPKTDKITL